MGMRREEVCTFWTDSEYWAFGGREASTDVEKTRWAIYCTFHNLRNMIEDTSAKLDAFDTSTLDWASAAASAAQEVVAFQATRHLTNALDSEPWFLAHKEAARVQADSLRDVMGNPFRPVRLEVSWLTSTVIDLAQAIYNERQFPSGFFEDQRMGVLADALEEAGCDDGHILSHLRCGREHVRGCWVIDCILDVS